MSATTPDDVRLLRDREVAELIGLDRRTFRRYVASGEAPQPIRLGRRATRWRLSDIREWLDAAPQGQ